MRPEFEPSTTSPSVKTDSGIECREAPRLASSKLKSRNDDVLHKPIGNSGSKESLPAGWKELLKQVAIVGTGNEELGFSHFFFVVFSNDFDKIISPPPILLDVRDSSAEKKVLLVLVDFLLREELLLFPLLLPEEKVLLLLPTPKENELDILKGSDDDNDNDGDDDDDLLLSISRAYTELQLILLLVFARGPFMGL